MSNPYWEKWYHASHTMSVDQLSIEKSGGTDWCNITMSVNGNSATITIRSKEQLEQLRFMLTQLLDLT